MFRISREHLQTSTAVGQWDLGNAYRYVSEANAGYHFDVNHGLNIDAGIFVSYIGLFSYYNFDNWTYQPSYVSSNTPWFFNGIRIQWFPTNKLKIEPQKLRKTKIETCFWVFICHPREAPQPGLKVQSLSAHTDPGYTDCC